MINANTTDAFGPCRRVSGRPTVAMSARVIQGNGNNMQARLDFKKAAPDVYKAMSALESSASQTSLESLLLELVKTRASQINNCAYCLDMHTKDARAQGETEQRLYALQTWRETPFFTERERAALAWTEVLTRISETHVTDELYAIVRVHFTEKELVELSLAIVAINGWNRLAIAFRSVPGNYQPS